MSNQENYFKLPLEKYGDLGTDEIIRHLLQL